MCRNIMMRSGHHPKWRLAAPSMAWSLKHCWSCLCQEASSAQPLLVYFKKFGTLVGTTYLHTMTIYASIEVIKLPAFPILVSTIYNQRSGAACIYSPLFLNQLENTASGGHELLPRQLRCRHQRPWPCKMSNSRCQSESPNF